MKTDYESNQYVEMIGPDEAGFEATFTIGLMCTANSSPGSFNPMDGGYPPEGPEFEVYTIQVDVPKVNPKEGEWPFEAQLILSYSQLRAIVGEEIADKLIDRAIEEACETGDF